LREEAARMVAEMAHGASPEAALEKAAIRNPGSPELRQFLESYRLSRTTGADLAHLLQTLLEGMEERNRILRKMDAMTAQARLSGWMMGLLPVFLLLAIGSMDPDLVLPLFTEQAGWGILLAAAFLEILGFLWIKRLMRIEA
jgi:tight adherence protein B